ncbi:hypothetical protein MY11210_000506 [Beauveria gryllotalpidicola]
MQLSIILASLCGMALAVPAVKIRSPFEVDGLGRPVPQVGEVPHGNPASPQGAGGNNELGDGIQIPENIDELAHQLGHDWNGQDLGADVFADLGIIANTPGVNALMLGAGDLRASLGLPLRNVPGQAGHPSFVAEVEKLVVAAARHKLPLIMAPAFHSSADPAAAASLRRFKIAPGHRGRAQQLPRQLSAGPGACKRGAG